MLRFAQLVDKFSDSMGKILSVVLVALTVIMGWEVVSRYVFTAPTMWAYELSGMLFVVCFMFGGTYTLRHSGHVGVDILYSRFSPRTRAKLGILTAPLMGLICWVFIWYGWKLALRSLKMLEHSQSYWSPPQYPLKILIVVAMVTFTFQVLANLIRDVHAAASRR